MVYHHRRKIPYKRGYAKSNVERRLTFTKKEFTPLIAKTFNALNNTPKQLPSQKAELRYLQL